MFMFTSLDCGNFDANFEPLAENNSRPSLPRYGQYMPIIMLVVATFTLIEAAGAADEYPALKGSSKVSQESVVVGKIIVLFIRLRKPRRQYAREPC